jgi:CheY-like chemotaxis protein
LTHRLLAFSRQQLLLPRALAARHMVGEVANLITSTFGPNISLTILPIPDDLAIMADAAQLEAAIRNLAMNARDAMGGSGRTTIEAYRADPRAEMALAPGDYVVIAIEDTGTGMDEATIAQACEPFFTTKAVDGSGLGLSMVQGFARQSGGDVHIVSAPGRGARVEIWLPPLMQPETEGAEPVAPVQKIVRGRVLLVGDDAAALVTVGAFLRNAGYVVTAAATGGQALAMLLAGTQFDAIVTDYALPGSNGIDIRRQACEIDKTLPGLIITGYYNAGLRDAVDGSLILRKPFSRAKLIERVEALVASRRELAAKSSDGAG